MKKSTFLKVLSVGALALTGMFAFAGCSSVEITQDQVNGIIDKVSQLEVLVDQLETHNEELKNQNEALNQQNNILEQILKTSQKETITKQEAWYCFVLAKCKYYNNVAGVRDNLKFLSKYKFVDLGTEKYNEQNFLRTENDGYIITYNSINEDTATTDLNFQDSTGVYKYIKKKDSTDKIKMKSYATVESNYRLYQLPIAIDYLEESNLIHQEILDNGNYMLYFSKESQDPNISEMVELELSQDCKFIACNVFHSITRENDGVTELSSYSIAMNWEYGTVSEDELASLLAEAKAHEITSNEGEYDVGMG